MIKKLITYIGLSTVLFFTAATTIYADIVVGTAGEDANKLQNPLKNIDSIPELVSAILKGLVQIGIPIAALFIVYSGFLFVLARGNEEKLKVAQRTLTYTIVGTAVLLGALGISYIIGGTLKQVVGI